ncbi:MAG: LptA/OstA family protein [Alphaproteobacteria bacterium]
MRHAFLALLLLTMAAPALAKKESSPLPASSKEPIEISAAKSLEWDRKNHTYTAKKSALAKQGHFQVAADQLVAKYRGAKGSTDIYELDAENSVVIQNPPYTAYGDHAIYDVVTGHAMLTGENLKIMTETESLTAKDSIEFFAQENRLTASGSAVAVKSPDTLKADVLNAYFQKDALGKLAMHKVTASGHVVIQTAKETVYGDKGTYDIPAQKAVMTGKVKIYQDRNWLEGTRAEVDMKTGISQLFAEGNQATEGRVKGIFYPKAQTGTNGTETPTKP